MAREGDYVPGIREPHTGVVFRTVLHPRVICRRLYGTREDSQIKHGVRHVSPTVHPIWTGDGSSWKVNQVGVCSFTVWYSVFGGLSSLRIPPRRRGRIPLFMAELPVDRTERPIWWISGLRRQTGGRNCSIPSCYTSKVSLSSTLIYFTPVFPREY